MTKLCLFALLSVVLATMCCCHAISAKAAQKVNVAVQQQTNVTFPSPGIKGGAIRLHGTLTTTTNSGSKKKFGAIFIHGSGPNDRYESFAGTLWNTDAKPNALKPKCGVVQLQHELFTDLTRFFVDNGIDTLAYDKRDCCRQSVCSKCVPTSEHKYPSTCYYACMPDVEPQQVNTQDETLDDIAMDAASALLYMQNQGYEHLIVVGHSEGVAVSPRAVEYYLNLTKSSVVSHIILLGGTQRDVDSHLVAQYQRINQRAKELETECRNDPSAPYSKELIESMQNIEMIAEQMSVALKDFFEKFRAGQYPLDFTYNIGGYVTGTYLSKWMAYTNVSNYERILRNDRFNRIHVMSINSPTDMNVHEEDYASLIQVLKSRSSQVSSSLTNIQIIPNLTHYMTNASFVGPTKQHIIPQVAQSIVDFIRQTPLKGL